MEIVFPSLRARTLRILASLILLAFACLPAGAQSQGINILPAGSFDNILPTYVPWAGVDANNDLHGIDGKQIMVNDAGHIGAAPFGSSVAVADLNGDGKNDLIMADSWGYFWYYPNVGTPQVPAFKQGEVIPIWLGHQPDDANHTEGLRDIVPRIQLFDFTGTKRMDLAAGTYSGQLFRIPNVGSSSQPNFKPTLILDSLIINTHRRGALWCNYLAPFFTNAFGGGNLFDLVMGEGTYSANSIWLLRNIDSNEHPAFDEDHIKRIIPGMGLEQLTPQVVDWNNDGKPDVISGDRTGYIDLFLNNSTDPSNPTFAPAVHVLVGGKEKIGSSITVTVCDLSNNHLPNLLIGKEDGTLLYAVNSGTLGNPQFNTPAMPLKGVLPPDYHYTSLTAWRHGGAFGAPYELVGATNPELEPGFAFPDGVKSNHALRFWVWPYKNLYFDRYYPPEENSWNEHFIDCNTHFTIKMNTHYRLQFWVLAPNNSVANFRYVIEDGHNNKGPWTPPGVYEDIPSSSTWTQVTKDFTIHNDPDPTIKQYDYSLGFRFHGEEPFYLDDVEILQMPN